MTERRVRELRDPRARAAREAREQAEAAAVARTAAADRLRRWADYCLTPHYDAFARRSDRAG